MESGSRRAETRLASGHLSLGFSAIPKLLLMLSEKGASVYLCRCVALLALGSGSSERRRRRRMIIGLNHAHGATGPPTLRPNFEQATNKAAPGWHTGASESSEQQLT